MKKPGEQFSFDIQPTIEQMPFTDPATQAFFRKWYEINSAITPKIISRKEWSKRADQSPLEKNQEGQTLFLPRDLQLWEMVGVMETIDRDTFKLNPEKQAAKKEQIEKLGKMFQNAGAYIAQRLEAIDQGKEIASALAEEFYQYGEALIGGHKPKTDINAETIARIKLDPKETEEVDRWLAGDSLYQSRRAKAEKSVADETQKAKPRTEPQSGSGTGDRAMEQERQKTLAQFFRVAEKAFELKQKSKSGELQPADTSNLNPWQSRTPLHTAFLQKIRHQITKEVETPKRELTHAIFRRGMEKLLHEMRAKSEWRGAVNDFFWYIGVDLQLEQKNFTIPCILPN